MLDPPERLRRFVSNVEAYHTDNDGEYLVLSYGNTTRFGRLYEQEQVIYGREDVLRRGQDGGLRIFPDASTWINDVLRNKKSPVLL